MYLYIYMSALISMRLNKKYKLYCMFFSPFNCELFVPSIHLPYHQTLVPSFRTSSLHLSNLHCCDGSTQHHWLLLFSPAEHTEKFR